MIRYAQWIVPGYIQISPSSDYETGWQDGQNQTVDILIKKLQEDTLPTS